MPSYSILNLFLLFLLLALIPAAYFKNHFGNTIQQKNQPGIPITVFAETENRIYRLDLESYLAGVIAAEMPARFELEALKAQAVAARTIAVYRLKRFGGNSRHLSGADLSDNPDQNQAWVSESSLRKRWGTDYEKYYTKITRAVAETPGSLCFITINRLMRFSILLAGVKPRPPKRFGVMRLLICKEPSAILTGIRPISETTLFSLGQN